PGGGPWGNPFGPQMPEQEAAALLVMDDDRPEPTADMGVDRPKSLDGLFGAQPKMRHPSAQVAAQVLHAGVERPPPVGRRHGSQGGLEPLIRFGRRHHDDPSTIARTP